MKRAMKPIWCSVILVLIILGINCQHRNAETVTEPDDLSRIHKLNTEIQTLFADSSIKNIEAYINIIEQKLSETRKELKYQQERLHLLEQKLFEKEAELQIFEQELEEKSQHLENMFYISLCFFAIGLILLAVTIFMRSRKHTSKFDPNQTDTQTVKPAISPDSSDAATSPPLTPDKD